MGALEGIWITRVEDAGRGVRLAVKDLFDTAGIRTTYGSEIFGEHVPERTAEAVRRLEGGGYATVGKANLHEFAYGITAHNPHYGDVPNPAAPGRVAGGSSGGCAAALAAGEADAALGTDSGGSVRIPAACCGVVGFKPSWALVPMDGCFPLAPGFDHAGPMARDVAGCARMTAVLAPGFERRAVAPADLRWGIAWTEGAEPAVRDAVARAAALVGALPVALPHAADVFPAFQREIAGVHRDLYARHESRYGENVRTKIGRCLRVSDEEDAVARAARERCRELAAAALAELDVVLTPTLPVVPPFLSVDELAVRGRMTENTFLFNAIGAPAVALPCGTSADGLPVSIQLAGRPGSDELLLGAAAALEAALGHTARPGGAGRTKEEHERHR